MKGPGWAAVRTVLHREFRELITISPSDRPWQMPFAAALASGLPLLVAAAFDRMADGVTAAIAGLVFLYLPPTSMQHRMATLMACCFGMIACYALGILCHLVPAATVPLITIMAILVTAACRYYRIGPPGSFFFIMAATIAAFAPVDSADLAHKVGIVAIGCMHAALVAFLYSLYALRRRTPKPVPDRSVDILNEVWVDAVLIGLSVGIALAIAQFLAFERAYWVPISCLAVLQGVTLRAAWNRQVHRVLGTTVGLFLTGALLLVVRDVWTIALVIILLTFLIEMAVVRHYGFATIFITPLTILLAEAPHLGYSDVGQLMEARFIYTLLGAGMGFVGAVALHVPASRDRMARILAALLPRALTNHRE